MVRSCDILAIEFAILGFLGNLTLFSSICQWPFAGLNDHGFINKKIHQ